MMYTVTIWFEGFEEPQQVRFWTQAVKVLRADEATEVWVMNGRGYYKLFVWFSHAVLKDWEIT